MKHLRKTKRLLQAGVVFLFCAAAAAGCGNNSSTTTSTTTDSTTMAVKMDTMAAPMKDSMPALDTDMSAKTRPETIKNGGTPPPPPPKP